MVKKVAIAAVIVVLVAIMLPVLFFLWYTMTHRLPEIGPFGEGSLGSSFIWYLIFAFIYVAILIITVKIINKIKSRGKIE